MTEIKYPWHSDIEPYTETVKDIAFSDYEDAESVVNDLLNIVDAHGSATMGEYLELCGLTPKPNDHCIGWTNISVKDVVIDANKDGDYYICLPTPNNITTWEKTPSDPVNHPGHYHSKSGLETIQVIEAFTEDCVGMEAVYTGNILKYVCRWKKKNGLEDLKKAQWYLNHLIDYVEKEKK